MVVAYVTATLGGRDQNVMSQYLIANNLIVVIMECALVELVNVVLAGKEHIVKMVSLNNIFHLYSVKIKFFF